MFCPVEGAVTAFHLNRHSAHDSRVLPLAALVIAAVVLAPILALALIAGEGSGDLWPHLFANVLPHALTETALLVAGVGVIVTVIGTGTAWLIAACRFPGRGLFEWALLLPLA